MKVDLYATARRLHQRFGVKTLAGVFKFVENLYDTCEHESGVLVLQPVIMQVDWTFRGHSGYEMFADIYSWTARNPEFAAYNSEMLTEIENAHDTLLNPQIDAKYGPRIPRGWLYLAGSLSGSRLLIGPEDASPVLLSLWDFEELGKPDECCVEVGSNWKDFLEHNWKPWESSSVE